MLTIAAIKDIRSLKNRKDRYDKRLFTAEGPKIVSDLINSGQVIKALYATQEYIQGNTTLLSNPIFDIQEISKKQLSQISNLKSPNEVLALCCMPVQEVDFQEVCKGWSVVLDGINDPGNLGTIIRMAHWLNITHVFCAPDSVDVYNHKTIQAAKGSITAVKVIYTDLIELLKNAIGKMPLYGTFMNGKDLYNTNFEKNGMLVLGNEANGISKEVEACISKRITIPRVAGSKTPDSLNVAVSMAFIGSELLRKQVLL